MAAKKFYAVAIGRKPGIYEDWPSARSQVIGYPGALYKGFSTREKAKAWLKNPAPKKGVKISHRTLSSSRKSGPAKPVNGIKVFSDGGARNNPGPGGYGIVIIEGGNRREISGGFNHTTNNRMELMGCIIALRSLSGDSRPISLYTDSSYVVNGINKGWAKNWRRKGWIKSDGKPALNVELWGELLDLIEDLDISFNWVKGHAGHPENERCDELAVAASYRRDLPEDKGYRGN